MSFSISRVQAPVTIDAPQNAPKRGGEGEFSSVLETAIDHVERSRQSATDTIRQLLNGEKEEIHSTVLATQQAELQFDMFLQVRNKVVSAYPEVMKMQV